MCKGSVIIICPYKSNKYSFMGSENKEEYTYLLILYIPTQASQLNISLPDQQRTYNMHQIDYQSLHPLSLFLNRSLVWMLGHWSALQRFLAPAPLVVPKMFCQTTCKDGEAVEQSHHGTNTRNMHMFFIPTGDINEFKLGTQRNLKHCHKAKNTYSSCFKEHEYHQNGPCYIWTLKILGVNQSCVQISQHHS